MRLPKRPTLDDVDVESCLANLHRVEEIGVSPVVVDLTSPAQPVEEVTRADAHQEARRRQSLTAGAGDRR